MNNGNCASAFDPHLLTAQFRDKARLLAVVFWGLFFFLVGGRKSGLLTQVRHFMRLVNNLIWSNIAVPPLPGKSSLVVGDMRSLKIEFFGEISPVMHCAQGDVQHRRLNVAYVLGVQFNFFSLNTGMPDYKVTLNAEGAHLLDGDLSFLRRNAGSLFKRPIGLLIPRLLL